jgi:hypothetical protein
MSDHAILCQLEAIRQYVVERDHANDLIVDNYLELREAAREICIAAKRAVDRRMAREFDDLWRHPSEVQQ